MKCCNELLTLAMSALLASSACGGSDEASKASGASAGNAGAGAGRPDNDRGGMDIVDAGAAHGGIQVSKASDAGAHIAEQPKGGSVATTPARAAGAGGMQASKADPGAADRGPYYVAEPWRGYLWTAKNGDGTTLSRSQSFQLATFDSQVCIQGSVARTSDSSANAMLGVNVDQAQHIDAEPLTIVPSKAGVQVDVTNPGGSPLRVQVAAPDGVANAQSRWCATLTGSGGFIPWSNFNTACWDGSGTAYRREPISVAMLLVPGDSLSAQAFDVCLLRLAEADAPPPGTGAGAAMSGSAGTYAADGEDAGAAGSGGAAAL